MMHFTNQNISKSACFFFKHPHKGHLFDLYFQKQDPIVFIRIYSGI